MNIAILGYGDQGRSAFEYWYSKDNVVAICDQNQDLELPEGAIDKLGPDYLSNVGDFDLLIRTPALHPRDIVSANLDTPDILDKVTTVTNEFFKVCPAPIIGVTGTKGKGTTSTLITRILEAAGKKVHLGGNIGTPPLDLLKNNIQPSDIVVLELANFQLIDLKQSPHIGVCLMITEEHLNWHEDMYEYTHAKKQMFVHQKHGDIAVYNALDTMSEEIATGSTASTKITYEVGPLDSQPQFTDGAYVDGSHIRMGGKTVCKVHDVKLLGRHNLQNVCAAIAATWEIIDHDAHVIKKVLETFTGLPNRLEPVRTHQTITYYNDSFASAPGALVAALNAIAQPKVMIVGGYDRFLNLDPLVNSLNEHKDDLRKILLVGASAERVAEACKAVGFTNFVVSKATTMDKILSEARTLASPNDAIILSPGFASFDMFKNFEDRGNKFRESVMAL